MNYIDFYSSLLLEEITERTSLYHRSPRKLTVGGAVEIPKGENGKHWLENAQSEIAMEYLRRKEFPDKPSRLNAVYSSLIPRARFVDKGYLYRVRPIGKIHVTDSLLIDTIGDKFEREYYEYIRNNEEYYKTYFKHNPDALMHILPNEALWYWTGQTANRRNIRDIEVLSEGAVVVEEVAENWKSQPLMRGDDVEVTDEYTLKATLDLYVNSRYLKGTPTVPDEEVEKMTNYITEHIFDGVKPENKHGSLRWDGWLKKGARLKITELHHSMANGRELKISGKHNRIMVDFYIGDHLVKRLGNEVNLTHRFVLAIYQYDMTEKAPFNFAKHLRKF